jgi:hypothetical protein
MLVAIQQIACQIVYLINIYIKQSIVWFLVQLGGRKFVFFPNLVRSLFVLGAASVATARNEPD